MRKGGRAVSSDTFPQPCPTLARTMGGRLEAEPRPGLVARDAVLGPAAQLVVLGEHLVELRGQTLGRARARAVLQEARRQRVVLGGEARAQVEVALEVPDTLADLQQLLEREAALAGGVDLRLDVFERPREGREQAEARGVDHRGRVLEGLEQSR